MSCRTLCQWQWLWTNSFNFKSIEHPQLRVTTPGTLDPEMIVRCCILYRSQLQGHDLLCVSILVLEFWLQPEGVHGSLKIKLSSYEMLLQKELNSSKDTSQFFKSFVGLPPDVNHWEGAKSHRTPTLDLQRIGSGSLTVGNFWNISILLTLPHVMILALSHHHMWVWVCGMHEHQEQITISAVRIPMLLYFLFSCSIHMPGGPQTSFSFSPSIYRIKKTNYYVQHFWWDLQDLNSDPHSCATSTLYIK